MAEPHRFTIMFSPQAATASDGRTTVPLHGDPARLLEALVSPTLHDGSDSASVLRPVIGEAVFYFDSRPDAVQVSVTGAGGPVDRRGLDAALATSGIDPTTVTVAPAQAYPGGPGEPLPAESFFSAPQANAGTGPVAGAAPGAGAVPSSNWDTLDRNMAQNAGSAPGQFPGGAGPQQLNATTGTSKGTKIALFGGLAVLIIAAGVGLGFAANSVLGSDDTSTSATGGADPSGDGTDGSGDTSGATEAPETTDPVPVDPDSPPEWAAGMLPANVSVDEVRYCSHDDNATFGIELPADAQVGAISCSPLFGGAEIFNITFIDDPTGVEAVKNGEATYEDVDLGIEARPGHNFRVIKFNSWIDVYDYTDTHAIHYELSGDEATAIEFIETTGLAG